MKATLSTSTTRGFICTFAESYVMMLRSRAPTTPFRPAGHITIVWKEVCETPALKPINPWGAREDGSAVLDPANATSRVMRSPNERSYKAAAAIWPGSVSSEEDETSLVIGTTSSPGTRLWVVKTTKLSAHQLVSDTP